MYWQVGRSVQEVVERVLVKHSMDYDVSIFDREVDPIVVGPETVEFFSLSIDRAKAITVDVFEILWRDLELIEQG